MLHLSASCQYFLYSGWTDMRKGFDSLGGLVMQQMQHNALSGAVFIFFNRKRNQVKLLHWEGDGFAVYYKRLEKGTYELPEQQGTTSSVSISSEQLQYILRGVALQSIRYRKRYQHRA